LRRKERRGLERLFGNDDKWTGDSMVTGGANRRKKIKEKKVRNKVNLNLKKWHRCTTIAHKKIICPDRKICCVGQGNR
jgi:hypothetical protein